MKKSKKSAVNAAADPKTGITSVVPVSAEVVANSPGPWEKPVDGQALLADIVRHLRAYMSISRPAAIAVALWILYSYTYNEFRISPILGVVSPTRRCGKTTLLTIVGFLSRRALATARITAAAIYRAMSDYEPTLIVDEIDSFLGKRNDLRGILNSGHARETAYVVLTVGKHAVQYTTWGPKVLALIGSLPSTLEDRSVVVQLRRKAPHEKVKTLGVDSQVEFEPLARKIARWAEDNARHLAAMNPSVPDKLHDRAADNWFPLLAIAERIGGQWPSRAREAALQLSDPGAAQNSAHGEMLLQDIQGILREKDAKVIESAKLVAALGEMEDRPWPTLFSGRTITKARLAALLRPFGIAPKLLRVGEMVFRGYVAADFKDAFERYAA